METNLLPAVTTENAKLPFAADEKSLTLWLASLSTSQSVPASEQILQVVRAINSLEIKAELKIKFLLRIHHFLPVIVDALQKTYMDKSLPLSVDAQQNIDRVIAIYIDIAQVLYINLMTHASLGKEAHVLSLHLSMDALTLALLHYSFGYQQNMPKLWQQCYSVYAYAEQANLLKITCKYPSGDALAKDAKPTSLETKFKHLLLYFLCDTQQFRAREQQMVFRYLLDYADAAVISPNYHAEMQQASYIFNLQTSSGPHKLLAPAENPGQNARYIYCLKAAKNLHTSVQPSDTSAIKLMYRDTLLKAASSLGLIRKRKYTRIKKSATQQGIIGFTHIIEFMSSRNFELSNSAPQNSAAAVFDVAPKATFDLVPLGDEVAHQMRAKFNRTPERSAPIGKIFSAGAGANRTSDTDPSCELTILDSSVKGYGLLTSNTAADVKIGDVLGLTQKGSDKLEISLIRRINRLADQNIHLGVEVLSFESELVFVSRKGQPLQGIWAIFIPEIASLKQPSSLIFNGSLIDINDIITVRFSSNSQNYSMQKSLLTTPAISFVQLNPASD